MTYKEKIEKSFGTTLNFFKSIKKTEDTAISFDSKFNNSKYELSKTERLLVELSHITFSAGEASTANTLVHQFLNDCRPKNKKVKKEEVLLDAPTEAAPESSGL